MCVKPLQHQLILHIVVCHCGGRHIVYVTCSYVDGLLCVCCWLCHRATVLWIARHQACINSLIVRAVVPVCVCSSLAAAPLVGT